MVSSETYKAIQNWIGRQQEYQAAHSTPAPLTDTQRKLLEKLELALPPETPPQPEPQLDNTNWIGELLEYQVSPSRRRALGGIVGVDFVEEPGPIISGVQKWRSHVRIAEHPDPFPGPAGGLLPDGSQPSFAQKKQAKKYAAKCAVEWLMANGHMPPRFGIRVTSTPAQNHQATSQPSPAKKPKLSTHSPEQVTIPTPNPNVDVSTTPTLIGSPLTKGPASPLNNGEISAQSEVKRLCTRLGFPDKPQYQINPSSDMSGFFSGYADMGMLASMLPIGIGRAENVFGSKKDAREKIAESLLVHLRELAAAHDKRDQEFLASLPPIAVAPKLPSPD